MNIEIYPRTLTILEKRGIETEDALARWLPKEYFDLRTFSTMKEAAESGKVVAIKGYCNYSFERQSKTGKMYGLVEVENEEGKIKGTFFGYDTQIYRCGIFTHTDVVIIGKVKYDEQWGYSMDLRETVLAKKFEPKIEPRYVKARGLSDEMREAVQRKAIEYIGEPLTHVKPSYKEAIKYLHKPLDFSLMDDATRTLDFTDLVYYQAKLQEQRKTRTSKTKYFITKSTWADDYIKSLPYELTKDQILSYEAIKERLMKKNRVNALLQGDVGFGKSAVAFLACLLMAENGYKSVLMAPTTVLAKQHFEELSEIAKDYGVKVVYMASGKTKPGLINVGTVGAANATYDNLGMVIIDEEQKFGVAQRDKLKSQTENVLSMSATPIPRTLALSLYGDDISLLELKTRPKGRSEIKTCITQSDKAIFKHIEREVEKGRQVYVVCPFIDKGEDKFENVMSIEEVAAFYKKYLSCRILVATGQMKKQEMEDVFSKFSNGEGDVLIATSIVEVGVNVPNASTIIINSCERFGLSTLHQLRGRVGRGKFEGYCILRPSNETNLEKLKEKQNILVETTDGFKIAIKDLENRKAGDLLGEVQTGFNKYVDLIIRKPELFEEAKEYLKKYPEDSSKVLHYFEE